MRRSRAATANRNLRTVVVADRYLMGVDIGTLGTKALVVSTDGEIRGSALAEYGLLHPSPSWAEQWPEVWENAVCQTIRESVRLASVHPDEIAGVCISGLYGGSGIPVDKEMSPLHPCLIWMDRRASDEVEWVRENADLDQVFRTTGNYVDTYFGYTKILWIKRNLPDVWQRIHKFIPPSTYVAFRLTGELAIDYSSAGNLGGLFDIRHLQWSEEMSGMLGIPLEMMPEKIVPSTEVIGEITPSAATRCGLTPGTPVVAGGVDAPMATLSAGATEPGENVAMMGTSTCWGVVHQGDSLAKKLVSMPHVVNCDREIYTWGGAATSGGLIRWFRNEFGAAEVARGETEGRDAYELLDSDASNVRPGSDNLVVLPYFMGERAPVWDPHARGIIFGLSLYHTRAHVFRAFLESSAFSLRHSIEIGENVGLGLQPETKVVGGITKSRLWPQILADVTGRRISVPAGGAGAPLGGALVAGLGVGLVDDYRVIREWSGADAVFEPNAGNAGVYDRLYAIYRGVYSDTKQRMHELTTEGAERNA